MKDPAPPTLHAPHGPPWPEHPRDCPVGLENPSAGEVTHQLRGSANALDVESSQGKEGRPGAPGNMSLWAKGSWALPGQAALTFWSLHHMWSCVSTAAVLGASLRTLTHCTLHSSPRPGVWACSPTHQSSSLTRRPSSRMVVVL